MNQTLMNRIGQKGIPLEFLGYGSGGEWRHEASSDCL